MHIQLHTSQWTHCVFSFKFSCKLTLIEFFHHKIPGKTCVACLLLFFLIFKVTSNRKWTCRRFKNALHDTVLHTDALCQISGSWPLWFQRKMWQKLPCEQKFAYVHNNQSPVKQEVHMPQIQKCVTRYSSPYWCSLPNIRKVACVVPE